MVLILAKGNEPFLHLGSNFSAKMTAADFQQMTLSIRSEFTNGNYAQATIDLLKQVQKKLSPDYTWIWVTLAVLVALGAASPGSCVRSTTTGSGSGNKCSGECYTCEASGSECHQPFE